MILLNPFQRISITESRKIYKPGSIGYIIYRSQLYQLNIWSTSVLFVKFGKTGKPRMTLETIHTQIVDIDKEFSKDNVEILYKSDYNYGTPFCTKGISVTKVEKISSLSKNLLKLNTVDFIHHLIALSIFVKKLSNDVKLPGRKLNTQFFHNDFNIDQFIAANTNNNGVLIIPPELFGEFLLHITKKDDEIINSFTEYFNDKQIRLSQMEFIYEELMKSRTLVERYIKNQQFLYTDLVKHGRRLVQAVIRKRKSGSFSEFFNETDLPKQRKSKSSNKILHDSVLAV